ncbi:hypothetical protein [Pseudomonas fluorescens]|uniref:Uncharacterized protein n=1 Tax=Pseudomonas fluorescens TaxID=294 RepID=A0A5E7AMH6_PSEFL|nr:hypothetical protein [Pseudomonas fluorescens]VVN79859.1 hypothetical protein PS691_01007 [Pseudomonas fluorescens]
MTEFIKSASENGLASTLIGAVVIGLISWLWQLRQNRKDSQTIFDFLTESTIKTPHTFRSTEAIASKTKSQNLALKAYALNIQKYSATKKKSNLGDSSIEPPYRTIHYSILIIVAQHN